MQLVLTPYYSDLFPGEQDKLEDLLAGIPSLLVLQLIAMIDAELYSRDEGNATQLKVFNLVLQRQSNERRLLILHNAVDRQPEPNTQYRLFTRHYNLNFIHYVLLHFQEIDDRDLTPQEEFNIFKAYFLVAQEFGQAPSSHNEKHVFDQDYFGKMMWPSLIDNFEIGHPVHPYFNMLRGVVFLNYLQYKTPYRPYVDQFLRRYNKASTLNYVFDVFSILTVNYQSLKVTNKSFAAFVLPQSEGFDALYEHFTMDLSQYQQRYSDKKANYSGIKAKPLLKLNKNIWIVLNWTFLSHKLYEGLLFDFYETSGIASEKQFHNIIELKRFIGENITERHLFKKLAQNTWNQKFEVLLFDDGKAQGFPDTYYRRGNRVFLFEIKDSFFASNTINSFSYEEIRAEIDKKVNSSDKGTGQLVKQIKRLIKGPFETSQQYRHTEDLEIYPIIVYTDVHFGMAGVNEYVGRCFSQMLTEANVRPCFKKIWPISMIHIDHLIEHFSLYRQQKTSLDKWVEYYHNQISARRKKHDRLRRLELYQEIFDVFENVTRPLGKTKKVGRKFIEWTNEVLDLSEGLPQTGNQH
jgi:hypothetical protein